MTISLPNCVIKPDEGIGVERYAFPLRVATVSRTDKRTGTVEPDTLNEGQVGNPESNEKLNPNAVRIKESILGEAESEARRMIERAGEEAENLLEEARKDALRMRESAAEAGQKEGFDIGYRKGWEKAEEELKKQQGVFQTSLSAALLSIEQAKDRSLRKYLDELKDCSLAVAEKVIHISLKSSGEVIKRMLIAETEKLKKTSWVKIYMERSDYEMMTEMDADVVSQLTRLSENIKFVVMNREKSGNCIIEMPEEIVDISVDTQLENVKEILQNIRS